MDEIYARHPYPQSSVTAPHVIDSVASQTPTGCVWACRSFAAWRTVLSYGCVRHKAELNMSKIRRASEDLHRHQQQQCKVGTQADLEANESAILYNN
jgi:hypothetical protein